jgi:hypothetical protein
MLCRAKELETKIQNSWVENPKKEGVCGGYLHWSFWYSFSRLVMFMRNVCDPKANLRSEA